MAVETIHFFADPIGWCGMHHQYLSRSVISGIDHGVGAKRISPHHDRSRLS